MQNTPDRQKITRRAFVSTMAASPLLLSAESRDEWIKLFDGHSLEGWNPSEHKSSWTVTNGMLTANGARSHLFYTGPVHRADDHASFYLSIKPQPDGSATAVIVNPEFNLFRRRSYSVTLNGANVTFTNPKNSQDHFNGTFDKASDRLFLPLLDAYPPLPLSRRDRGGALGFYARTPGTAKYTYIKPIASDGWPTASLTDVGISEKPIVALIERILTADPTDNPVDIDSLLIARHGRLVLEEYFHAFDKERPHDMRSASKTLAPMLAGIARDHGVNLSPDTPLTLCSQRRSHLPTVTHARAL